MAALLGIWPTKNTVYTRNENGRFKHVNVLEKVRLQTLCNDRSNIFTDGWCHILYNWTLFKTCKWTAIYALIVGCSNSELFTKFISVLSFGNWI